MRNIRTSSRTVYTVSHRECGQFRHYVMKISEKFKKISTPTGSWIRSRLRRDRIQLPVGVEIFLSFSEIFMNTGTELSTLSMGQFICHTFPVFDADIADSDPVRTAGTKINVNDAYFGGVQQAPFYNSPARMELCLRGRAFAS